MAILRLEEPGDRSKERWEVRGYEVRRVCSPVPSDTADYSSRLEARSTKYEVRGTRYEALRQAQGERVGVQALGRGRGGVFEVAALGEGDGLGTCGHFAGRLGLADELEQHAELRARR